MSPDEFDKLNKKHPYLTYINFDGEDIIGIVQTIDAQMLSIYAYNYIQTANLKLQFLELGQLWWDDSNHLIPINIFLREEFNVFKDILRCFPVRDVKNLMGPVVNIEETFIKRIKKKKIQLIRHMKP